MLGIISRYYVANFAFDGRLDLNFPAQFDQYIFIQQMNCF